MAPSNIASLPEEGMEHCPRVSRELLSLRRSFPYIDYYDPSHLPHAHPAPLPEADGGAAAPSKNSRWLNLKSGYGSRHVHDVASFSLWEESAQTFRNPTQEESQWVVHHYKAKEVITMYPVLIIVTDIVPSPLPLTVACVAARFTPPSAIPRPPTVNTCYASPRVPDPVDFVLPRWKLPNGREIDQIIRSLLPLASVQAISWLGPWCYVELSQDGRAYEARSLPGYVAGKSTTYHHSEGDFWKDMEVKAQSRAIDPQAAAMGPRPQDTTNYLAEGIGMLHPGVRIANSLDTHGATFSNQEKSTTCGARLRNPQGQVAVTVATQGVPAGNHVYHPSSLTGSKIGEVVERWDAHDIAMVSLIPAVGFTNDEYFEATPPRRLLRSQQLTEGAWCSVDGMSTGIVFLQCDGLRAAEIDSFSAHGTIVDTVRYRTEMVYNAFGPLGGEPVEGICGAPIVEEECAPQGLEGGGVYGFYRFGNSDIAVTEVLDDVIDAGWEVY